MTTPTKKPAKRKACNCLECRSPLSVPEALERAIDLIDELRPYAAHWDWKYGKSWDDERAALSQALKTGKK